MSFNWDPKQFWVDVGRGTDFLNRWIGDIISFYSGLARKETMQWKPIIDDMGSYLDNLLPKISSDISLIAISIAVVVGIIGLVILIKM